VPPSLGLAPIGEKGSRSCLHAAVEGLVIPRKSLVVGAVTRLWMFRTVTTRPADRDHGDAAGGLDVSALVLG